MKLHEGIRHYGLEFLTVFLGVSLSLLAENWRQNRSDLSAEHNSLVQLYSDLGLENGDMVLNMSHAQTGLASSRWLLANGARGHAVDSVSTALTDLGQCSFFIPYASEYTALKSSGRLSIIEEARIRQDIVQFYEREPFVQWLHERDCTLTGELMDSLLGKLEFAEPLRDTIRTRSGNRAGANRNGRGTGNFGSNGVGSTPAQQAGQPTAQQNGATRTQQNAPRVRQSSRYPRIVFHAGQEPLLDDPILRDRIVRLATQRQYLVDQIQSRMDQVQRLRTEIRTRLGSDTTAIEVRRGGRTLGGAQRNTRRP